jgi:hypothetical protein
MIHYIINYIKSFFYSNNTNYIKIPSINDDNTFVYIPKQPKKEIIKQEPIYKSIEFLKQIREFKFTNKNKK